MAHVATVTIDSDQVPADATNFPAYINLAHLFAGSESFASTVANGGGDIRVFQGATELAREVVSCDTSAETGELHVLIPFLDSSADTVLSIYADGSSADYAVDDPFGRNAVWGDYAVVSHDGATNSTGNADGVLGLSAATSSTDSKLGTKSVLFGAASFNNRLTYSGSLISSSNATISLWEKTAVSSTTGYLVSDGNDYNNLFFRRASSTTTSGWFGETGGSNPTIGNSDWFSHAFTHNSSGTWFHYIDGSQAATNTGSNFNGTLTGDLVFGNRSGGDRPYQGHMDEIRVRDGASLSANWITTEYNNQSDPSSFYTATDPNAGGGVSVAVPAASVTITGYAPTVTGAASISVDVPAGEISVTGYAPTVTSTDNIEVAIPADSLTVTGYAPTVTASDSQEVSPGADSIAVTGYAPTIAITDAQAIVIPAGSVTVTGYAPSVETTSNVTVEVDTGSVSITGHAPAVGTSISVSPAVSTLSITGYAPAVVASVKTVTCTLVDVNGRALPNLSDLSYAWFDEPDPANLSTPVVKGVTESTDGSGVIEVPISGSSLTSGQTGLLVLRSSDGESLGAYNLPVA
jgi:hypothetical protein